MLNRIIQFSLRNKLIVILMTLGLLGYGIYNITRLPIDAVPDITNNQVMVITVSPGLGATDIERFLTIPIEQGTRNIPGITEQRSFSRFGLSIVTIVFNDHTDIYWARQQISERLSAIREQIPAGMGVPELGPVSTGLGEIYQYVIKPKPGYENKYDLTKLRSIQDWIVRKQLLGTEGVADVSSFGGNLKQYEVAIDPHRLQAYGITINELYQALEQNNQNTGGGYIEKGGGVLFIRTEGLVGNLDDISNTVVKQETGKIPVLVRDVATVKTGHAIRYGAMTFNSSGEVAGAVVMMLKGANSNTTIKNIKDRIALISKTLPEGVEIVPFLDRTKMVNNAIGTVEHNLIEGALIVIFVLVLFLGNIRAGLVVASVIPLAMLFAVIMMNLTGVSGNLMSLGALDFGLLVDGAVIIVEAVMHKLKESSFLKGAATLNQAQMDHEVEKASEKMMNSAVFGQIIILIVYLPILSLQGIEGKMFKPMAETVSFAIIGAFLLSLTYVPVMTSLMLGKKVHAGKNFSERMIEKLHAAYEPVLMKVLTFPKWIIGGTVAVFAIALYTITTLGGEFIPQLEEGDFAVETHMLTGASLPTMVKSMTTAATILKQHFPEVKRVVGKIGSSEIPTDPMPMDAADMIIDLTPKSTWTSAHSFPELAEKMSRALKEVPGLSTGFQFPVQMRFNELMTGSRQDVVVKIFGENLDTLSFYAGQVGRLIHNLQGARDFYRETVTGIPQVVITYNRNAIAAYGARIEDINNVVRTAYAGAVTGSVFEGEQRYDMVIRMNDSLRANADDIGNLPVNVSGNQTVPLRILAQVNITDGPYQIQREEAQRRITVGFNVRGRDVQSIVQELQQKIAQNVQLPAGYHISYGGQYENLQHATKRLSIAVPLALCLILLMLFFAFKKLRYCAIIFSAIFMSAIGGVFALYLRGMPFSISAGIGFIALFGIAVLNGIVLITEMNRIKNALPASQPIDLKAVILQATETRLRPVLMTATVASMGFLPMAISNGAGGEVQRPLATVVIGGLITATFLTLFVLPCLYFLLEKKHLVTPENTVQN